MCFIINLLLAAEGMVKINPCDRQRCLHATTAVRNHASAQFDHTEGGFKDPKDTNPRQTILQEGGEGVTPQVFAEERKNERHRSVVVPHRVYNAKCLA